MNYDRLKKNLMDVVHEQQLKIGYRKEKIRVFYPLSSLCHLLEADLMMEEMKTELERFSLWAASDFGQTGIRVLKDGRIGLVLSEQAAEYIHQERPEQGFLADLIRLISKHDIRMDEVKELFHQYSDHVVQKEMDGTEFDLLLYFENGLPDPYYYCFTQEGHHITFHRFIQEDYEDYHF